MFRKGGFEEGIGISFGREFVMLVFRGFYKGRFYDLGIIFFGFIYFFF